MKKKNLMEKFQEYLINRKNNAEEFITGFKNEFAANVPAYYIFAWSEEVLQIASIYLVTKSLLNNREHVTPETLLQYIQNKINTDSMNPIRTTSDMKRLMSKYRLKAWSIVLAELKAIQELDKLS